MAEVNWTNLVGVCLSLEPASSRAHRHLWAEGHRFWREICGASTAAFFTINKAPLHLQGVQNVSTKSANLKATRHTITSIGRGVGPSANSRKPIFGWIQRNFSSAAKAVEMFVSKLSNVREGGSKHLNGISNSGLWLFDTTVALALYGKDIMMAANLSCKSLVR